MYCLPVHTGNCVSGNSINRSKVDALPSEGMKCVEIKILKWIESTKQLVYKPTCWSCVGYFIPTGLKSKPTEFLFGNDQCLSPTDPRQVLNFQLLHVEKLTLIKIPLPCSF